MMVLMKMKEMTSENFLDADNKLWRQEEVKVLSKINFYYLAKFKEIVG